MRLLLEAKQRIRLELVGEGFEAAERVASGRR